MVVLFPAPLGPMNASISPFSTVNDILFTALRCIWDTDQIDSLIMEKGILNNLFKAIKK